MVSPTYSFLVITNQWNGICQSETSTWNCLGYCPIVGTLSGAARLSLGLVDMVHGLAMVIFKEKMGWKYLSNGLDNVFRGAFEMIPCSGLGLFALDYIDWSQICDYIRSQPERYAGFSYILYQDRHPVYGSSERVLDYSIGFSEFRLSILQYGQRI